MKSIAIILHEADPVRHEPDAASDARHRVRRTVLAAAPATRPAVTSYRRAVLAAAVALAIAAVGLASRNWFGSATLQAAVRFEVRLAQADAGPGLQPVQVAGTDTVLYLHPEPIVTNDDIQESHLVPHPDSPGFDIAITFNAAGAAKMRAATAAHMGEPLAILIDGEVVAAPVVRSVVADRARITGTYTKTEAERIARGILIR